MKEPTDSETAIPTALSFEGEEGGCRRSRTSHLSTPNNRCHFMDKAENYRVLLCELHSSVADIARRIGVAADPKWIKGELQRVLQDTKYTEARHPSKESIGPLYKPSQDQGVPFDE